MLLALAVVVHGVLRQEEASGLAPGAAPRLHAARMRAPSVSARRAPAFVMTEAGGPEQVPDPNATGSSDESGESDPGSTSLWLSLRSRQIELEKEVERRWRDAEGVQVVPLALSDWIRRVGVDWPQAVVGTASGGVVVVDLENGDGIAQAATAHPGIVDSPDVASALRLLYGDFDGGGVLAVAMTDDRVVSAGRDGGARLWRIEGDELVPQSRLGGLDSPSPPNLVSSLSLRAVEDGYEVWAGSLDGYLRRWDVPTLGDHAVQAVQAQCSAPVLSLAVCAERGLVACGTATGTVEVFNATGRGRPLGVWMPKDSIPREGARSVAFVPNARGNWELVVGGSEGKLYRRELLLEAVDGSVFSEDRPGALVTPPHTGAVVALEPAGCASLFVSASRDGTVRVYDLAIAKSADSDDDSACLYGLGGFKVWLGSICAVDGCKLVSDGRDNAVVLYDFSIEAGPESEGRPWPPLPG